MILSKRFKEKKTSYLSLCIYLFSLSTVIGSSQLAYAGSYSDELSLCLVRSATSADKATIVQWFFSIISSHPDLSRVSSISNSKRADINKRFAKLFESLLTQACKSETKALIRYEGADAVGESFGALASQALTDLISNPSVSAKTYDFIKYMDFKKVEKILGDIP
jgi:hypothetical protein